MILTAKNLNFRAQQLYWVPTIENTYANGLPEQSCSMVALHDFASRGLRKPKMVILGLLTAKNLNVQAQRLYLTPIIEITCWKRFPEQSCSMVALHDLASRGL